MGSIWTVGRRAEAEAAKLTQPFQGIVSLGTGFLSGFFFRFFSKNMMKFLFPLHIPIQVNMIFSILYNRQKLR